MHQILRSHSIPTKYSLLLPSRPSPHHTSSRQKEIVNSLQHSTLMTLLAEIEERVIEDMLAIESKGHETVFRELLQYIDLNTSAHLWMLGRNFYHVAYSRRHSLLELLELAKLIDKQIPNEHRNEWIRCLSIPIVTTTWDDDGLVSYRFTEYVSNYVFGYLSRVGLVDVCERLSTISPLLTEVREHGHLARSMLMKAFLPVIVSNRASIMSRNPEFYQDFRNYLKEKSPHMFKELESIEQNDIDGLQILECDVKCGAMISFDAYLLMILSLDDVENLRKLSSAPDFDCNMRVKRSIITQSPVLAHQPTLLHIAAFYGSINCFKFLLLNQADLKLTDLSHTRNNLVDFAVIGGNIEILQLCAENGVSFRDAAFCAIAYQRNDVFFWLLERGSFTLSDKNMDGLSLMDMAASCNNVAIARFLYDSAGPPQLQQSEEHQSALSAACVCDCLSIVEIICTREGEIPDETILEAILDSVRLDSLDVVKYLVGIYERLITPTVLESLIRASEQASLPGMKLYLQSLHL